MKPFLGFLCVLLAGACAANKCAKKEGPPLLAIYHSSGGPGPVVTGMITYQNRVLELATARGQHYCHTAPEKEFRDIERYVRSADILTILGRIGSQSFEDRYFDYEELEIYVDNLEVTVPIEELPSELAPFLRSVDSLFSRAFGRPYKRPWSAEVQQ